MKVSHSLIRVTLYTQKHFYIILQVSYIARLFKIGDIWCTTRLIVFISGRAAISHNIGLMHAKYILALCQNNAFMSIIAYML